MTEQQGTWGGARPGTGNPEFKPKWKSGKTTVIRVPEAIADEVLAIARQIDEKEALQSRVTELEATLTVLRDSVEPLKRDIEKLKEQIKELNLNTGIDDSRVET